MAFQLMNKLSLASFEALRASSEAPSASFEALPVQSEDLPTFHDALPATSKPRLLRPSNFLRGPLCYLGAPLDGLLSPLSLFYNSQSPAE